MGNLFSKTNDKSTASKADKEYQAAIQKLKEQEEALYKAAQESGEQRKRIMEESLKRQEEITRSRIKELDDSLKRLEELKDVRRLLNVQASQLLCAIYYNYQFGDVNLGSETEWVNNVTNVITKCLNINVFNLLCKIPQLLPLLWPTGTSCDSFHIYELNDNNEPIISNYKLKLNTQIESYIQSTLSGYLINVCKSNCKKYTDFNQERNDTISEKCKKYLTSVETLLNDNEWVKSTIAFIADDDKMNWKCFAARSGKGICNNRILLLPSTYPKVYPKYELYECLLMLANTIINHYGDLRNNKDGTKVSAGSLDAHTNGGKCFSLNESFIINTFDKGIDVENIWDGETFTSIDSIVLSGHDVTGVNDDSWMLTPKLHDKTKVYAQNIDGKGGFKKYENPTQKYTSQFINDDDNIEVAFQMPRLSAEISNEFTKNFLKNAFELLQTKNYMFFNIYATNNKNIFTSFDYMTLTPKGFEQLDNVSPIARYMYEILIKDSCKWFITLPIESTMSMYKINHNILKYDDGKNKAVLPQYIWSDSKNVTFEVKNIKPYINIDSSLEFTDYKPSDMLIS